MKKNWRSLIIHIDKMKTGKKINEENIRDLAGEVRRMKNKEEECEYCKYLKEQTNIVPPICEYHKGFQEGKAEAIKDFKEFIKLLKEEIERLHDEQRKSQEETRNPDVAFERLNKASLIFGNGGILELIDKRAGEKLKENEN